MHLIGQVSCDQQVAIQHKADKLHSYNRQINDHQSEKVESAHDCSRIPTTNVTLEDVLKLHRKPRTKAGRQSGMLHKQR